MLIGPRLPLGLLSRTPTQLRSLWFKFPDSKRRVASKGLGPKNRWEIQNGLHDLCGQGPPTLGAWASASVWGGGISAAAWPEF